MTILRKALVASAILCSGAVPHFAAAQSFDCQKATNKAERAICGSDQLKYFDELLDQAYRGALHDPKLRTRARQSQKSWLEERNKCGSNHSCLLSTYQNRLAHIETGDFGGTRSEEKHASGIQTCAPSDVRVQSSGVGDGGGSIINVYYFVNKGEHACRIEGYPKLSAYDESGTAKSNGISYENDPEYTTDPAPKIAPVVLAGQPSCVVSRPRRGRLRHGRQGEGGIAGVSEMANYVGLPRRRMCAGRGLARAAGQCTATPTIIASRKCPT